jgi:preprotein translocase subunit SecA
MPAMRQLERAMLLRVIDTLWIEHLETMQYLRTGIGLRGYGQRDPLIEYKREGLRMFKELLADVDRQVAYSIYKVGMVSPEQMQQQQATQNLQFSAPSKESAQKSPMAADEGVEARAMDKIVKDEKHFDGAKVGRNDQCPCGSGKKFKNCHGK